MYTTCMRIRLGKELAYEVEVDENMEPLLAQLTVHGWAPLATTLSLSTRRRDREILGLPPKKACGVTMNRLVFWHKTGEWLERGTVITHISDNLLDFRAANLRIMRPGERLQRLLACTPPASAEKGISVLPNGQFKVQAYDPATKRAKYVGLRNTRDEAVELKRAFLAGEVGFRSA